MDVAGHSRGVDADVAGMDINQAVGDEAVVGEPTVDVDQRDAVKKEIVVEFDLHHTANQEATAANVQQVVAGAGRGAVELQGQLALVQGEIAVDIHHARRKARADIDRKSTRLNSSH